VSRAGLNGLAARDEVVSRGPSRSGYDLLRKDGVRTRFFIKVDDSGRVAANREVINAYVPSSAIGWSRTGGGWLGTMVDQHTSVGMSTVVGDDPSLLFGDEFGSDVDTEPEPRRRRRGRRILAVCSLVILLLLGLVAGTVFALSESLGNNVARVPNVFGPLDLAGRPAAAGGLTFLLVGTDSRSPDPTTGTDASSGADPGSQRSDVVMIAQISPDRTSASVISIPRDSWVDIPGRGKNKVNAAYSFGGPSLLVQTVENLTALRIDHFAVIDFAGFEAMVDAVGGIDVKVAKATSSSGVGFREGANHLDGAKALAYVRQRHGLPGGDLDRAQRQQNALRELLGKAASSGMLADPVKLYRLIDATSRSVGVDDTLSNGGLRSLALDMRGLRPANITFLKAPVRGLGREGAQSVVYLDGSRSAELWSSLRKGSITSYASAHPADSLEEAPA
jgi:LCP family protein required for cell wall assembly